MYCLLLNKYCSKTLVLCSSAIFSRVDTASLALTCLIDFLLKPGPLSTWVITIPAITISIPKKENPSWTASISSIVSFTPSIPNLSGVVGISTKTLELVKSVLVVETPKKGGVSKRTKS